MSGVRMMATERLPSAQGVDGFAKLLNNIPLEYWIPFSSPRAANAHHLKLLNGGKVINTVICGKHHY
jgi:hypothetical protein